MSADKAEKRQKPIGGNAASLQLAAERFGPISIIRSLLALLVLSGLLDHAHRVRGLPELWWFQVGETIQSSRDTGELPDLPGHYLFTLAGTSSAPGSMLSAEYELTAAVGREEATWGGVKSLYR